MKPQRNNGNSLSNITYAGVLKRLFPFAQKYYRAIVISLILTVIVASLTQVTPLVIKYIVDQVTKYIELGQGLNFLISSLVVGSLILATKELVVFAANYFVGYYGEYLKIKIGTDLSNTAFSHLLSLDMSYFDSNDNEVGRLTKRVDRGIDGLSKTVKNLFVDILPLIFNATLSLIVMFSVNFWVGITASLIIPLYFYLSYTQAKKQMGVRNSIQEISENRTSTMLNVLSAIKLVKSYRRENLESNKFDIINSQLSSNEVNHHKTNRLFDGLKLLFDRIGAVLIIVVTVILILNGKASVGAITLHLLLYDNITAPIRHLHRIYDETNEAIAFAEGYFAILEAQPLLVSEKTSSPSNGCNGSLEMDNVHFSYIKGNEVLHGISFKIPAKKTVALIGLSGAGKTTIANLLGRFYDPDQGSILLDEMDLNKYPIEFIRENTGFVLQESHIFSGTIAENIRYGKETATVEEVVQAAKLAGLHEDIIKLLNGYESSARNLSGGQKQRIAIARVFLKDPPILILDEPTASLDAVTSERIQGALKALRTSRTVLIISHNLASIVDADIIYVIKEGVLVGTGTHQTLYKENEHYQKLIDANIEAMNLDKFMSVRQEKQVS